MPSVVSLFCEDIREEKSGQDTLVGVLPDNLAVSGFPGMMPKFAVYVRIHIEVGVDVDPKSIAGRIINSDGTEVLRQPVEPDIISKALADARAAGMPMVGFILKSVMTPFAIRGAGKIISRVTIDNREYIGGVINLTSSAATVSPQPS